MFTQHVFSKTFLADSTRSGHIPHWNPYIFCGSPFLASMQGGVFYPTHILYLIFPVVVAINLDFILQVFLAALFMYLLLRDLDMRKSSKAPIF